MKNIIDEIKYRMWNFKYELMPTFRRVLRRLFWPKCDLCHGIAYYEIYPEVEDYWAYICWECSIARENAGFKDGYAPIE